MRGIVWTGDEVTLAEVPWEEPPPGWVTVDVAYVGLCGTDLHIADAIHPRARPGILLGHELVGTVEGRPVFVDPGVADGTCEHCRAGDTQLCAALRVIGVDLPGGLAARVAVPPGNLVALDDGIDLADAVLIEPLATAVRAVRRAGVRLGEAVLVAGFGPIGCLVALVARAAGATVSVVEPVPTRAARARELGFDAPPAPADVLVDCAGHPAVAGRLTDGVRTGGRAVVVGVHAAPALVDLQSLTLREVTVVGSRAYSRADVGLAIDLLARDAVGAGRVVSAVVGLDEVPDAFASLRSGVHSKVVVRI